MARKVKAKTNNKATKSPKFKVAIVHDWLIGGGAEKVVLQLHKLYPDAPIYTAYSTKQWRDKLNGQVITSYMQLWPFSRLRKFLPVLRMYWFRRLNLSGYDLVISSSGNGEAKHVLNKKPMLKKPLHVSYCHSPVHFYWRHYSAYLKNPGFGAFNAVARGGLRLFVNFMRRADYEAAQRVDFFIANSNHIKKDIRRYYDHDATVIHPPVDIERFKKPKASRRKGFVTVGRLVPNKRVDIIIKACNELKADLTVVGSGPELAYLKKIAGPTIKFDTNASDKKVTNYLAGAKAFLFTSFEDFGIAPVEAMASGTPVIAYKAGGALDYIRPNKTGLFFGKQDVESLVRAIKRFEKVKFKPSTVSAPAQKFAPEKFRSKMRRHVGRVLRAIK